MSPNKADLVLHNYLPAGQWVGSFTGRPSSPSSGIFVPPGHVALSVDEDRPEYPLVTFVQSAEMPAGRANLAYTITGDKFAAHSIGQSLVFDRNNRRLIPVSECPNSSQFIFSSEVTAEGKITVSNEMGHVIEGVWTGNAGTNGTFRIVNSINLYTPPTKTLRSWENFKEEMQPLITDGGDYIFRGHRSNKWRLTSSFHRKKRYDLVRYRDEACEQLVRQINAQTKRRLNIQDGVDFAVVLNLAQHHGFPTPLVDWTYSPYIAAYLAYADPIESKAEMIRIFVLNRQRWQEEHPQPAELADPAMTVSFRDFEPFDNSRQIAQQSCHTFTNVADVEAWIEQLRETRPPYLLTYDLPVSERPKAIRDLRYMGVTAASLFPGLDGTCRALKERFFKFD